MLAVLLISAPLLAATTAGSAPVGEDIGQDIGQGIGQDIGQDIGEDTAAAAATVEQRRGTGVGLGMHMGMWGQQYGSGFRLDMPVHDYVGFRLRTTTQYANTTPEGESGYNPTNGAGLELFLRSPVLADRFRLSLGGGPLAAIDGSHEPALGAGGHVGLETFASRRTAIGLELGGQGGPGALDSADGFSAMLGVTVYLGKL